MGEHGARSQRGTAVVEMAVVLPLLVLLLFGIWTTARAYNVKNTMDHAVREAARFGATVDPWDSVASPAAVRAVADVELASAGIPVGTITDCVDLGADPCGADPADQISDDIVAVQLTYPNYPLDFIAFSIRITLNAEAVARYES